MKYLSFIIGLLLLATLFSFVLTQLNKDETKHEYGIAFPLEESESRLPALSSVVQLEIDAAKTNLGNVKDSEAATTTTETVATSPKTTEASAAGPENTAAEMVIKSVGSSGDSEISVLSGESADGGSSIIIESSSSSAAAGGDSPNDTEGSDGSKDGKDSSEETGDGPQTPLGATNPKLVFIERLMGLNFQQRAPSGGFSSFLEMRGESNDAAEEKYNNNKTEGNSPTTNSEDDDGSKGDTGSSPELPWGNTIESLRSRWESRIRKFTFPFQNSYSVVLRASGMASDASESKDSISTDSADAASTDNADSVEKTTTTVIKPVDVPDRSSEASSSSGLTQDSSSFGGPKFFFHSTSSPFGHQQPQSQTMGAMDGNRQQQDGSSSQANQLLRMAALSMMSKLFTALRNQAVYSNPKLDSGAARFGAPSSLDHSHAHPSASSLSALDGHDLDLDDDDEENDIDSERGDGKAADGGGLPVPIIIARPNRMGSIDSASSSSSSYGYGNDGAQSPVRTSVMFGRPSTASAHHHHQGPIMTTQRIFSSSGNSGPTSGPLSPLAAILAATMARQRRMESMSSQQEQQQAQSQQPQRLILLISHRSPMSTATSSSSSSRDEMPPMSPVSVASRLQMFGRDEPQLGYPQSSSGSQALFHYAPLSPPSSPIYYHFSPQASAQSSNQATEMIRPSSLMQSIAASLQAQSQPQPQVVEVPVPVYLPMMRMNRHSSMAPSASSAVGPAPIRRIVTLPRAMMMPAEPRGLPVELPISGSAAGGSGGGHVALLMVQHSTPNDQAGGDSLSESLAVPHHVEPNAPLSFSPSSSSSSSGEASSSEPASGFVRIFLRPKMSSAMAGRLAFHRRLDDSAEEDMPTSAHQLMAAHHAEMAAPSPALDSARLRQWRDYSQFVRSAPAPMGPSSSSSSSSVLSSAHGSPVAHLLIHTGRADQEVAGSEEHYQQQQQQQHQPMVHFGAPMAAHHQSPFFFQPHYHQQQQQQAAAESTQQMLTHPLMMAIQQQQHQQQTNSQAAVAASGPAHHQHSSAFFILAEPNSVGAHSSEAANSGSDA